MFRNVRRLALSESWGQVPGMPDPHALIPPRFFQGPQARQGARESGLMHSLAREAHPGGRWGGSDVIYMCTHTWSIQLPASSLLSLQSSQEHLLLLLRLRSQSLGSRHHRSCRLFQSHVWGCGEHPLSQGWLCGIRACAKAPRPLLASDRDRAKGQSR